MKNKWALITGASAGIGREVATQLAKEGCHLIICGRRVEKLEELSTQLKDTYQIEVLPLSFDIQDKESIEKTFTKNKEALQKVSILVNNAGMAKGVDAIDKSDPNDWDQMIDTNLKGLLYVTRFMFPYLKAKENSDIINLGSVAGRWTYPGGAVYCATKHAVRAISEGIRHDTLGTNIRVCCIEPGMVNTEFSTVRLGNKEAADNVYKGMTPLSAVDIAESIVWTLKRPKHVTIAEMIIFPTDQASVTQVNRS